MLFVCAHVEYCDMHFVYGFCDGNAHAAVEAYQKRFPDRRIPSRSVFTRIHETLRDIGSLPSVSVQSEREVVHCLIVFCSIEIFTYSIFVTLLDGRRVDGEFLCTGQL